jgi:tRNA(Ile)-lysidine synthase
MSSLNTLFSPKKTVFSCLDENLFFRHFEELLQKAEGLWQHLKKESFEKKIAVAVSGGADSLCLTLLMNQWSLKNGYCLTALTVDHQLRPESGIEAQAVHQLLKDKNICHHILVWQHEPLLSRIEEKAREARYGLLSDFCKQKNIPFLLTAHTQNDQTETFLLRLSKGSGPDGLAGIKPVFATHNLVFLRPLLEFTKEDIIVFLQKNNLKWIEDPSNQNEDFDRVRLRKERQNLEKIGLTQSCLVKSIHRLHETSDFIEEETGKALDFCAVIDPKGYAVLKKEKFLTLSVFLQKRILNRLLFLIGGKKYAPSWEKTETLLETFPQKTTLGGCLFFNRADKIFICKEPARMEKERILLPDKTVLWDRFLVRVSEKVVIAALKKAVLPTIPAQVQKSWPAFYSADGKKTLLSIPSLDRNKEKPHLNESRRFECVFLDAFNLTQERWKQYAETK